MPSDGQPIDLLLDFGGQGVELGLVVVGCTELGLFVGNGLVGSDQCNAVNALLHSIALLS